MVDLQEKSIEMWRNQAFELHWKLRKAEEALLAIKAMHHEGGIDDLQERDDSTYVIVHDTLEELK